MAFGLHVRGYASVADALLSLFQVRARVGGLGLGLGSGLGLGLYLPTALHISLLTLRHSESGIASSGMCAYLW